MKKLTVMLLVMTLVFGLAACGNASEKGSNVTETQAQSAEDTGAGNAELNKLYEKENAIIAKHQELWNTAFNNIDKLQTQENKIMERFWRHSWIM